MKNAITNSCGNKRGCYVVITLPYDRMPGTVFSGMHGGQHDLQKVLPASHLLLDKKPEKTPTLEKVAA